MTASSEHQLEKSPLHKPRLAYSVDAEIRRLQNQIDDKWSEIEDLECEASRLRSDIEDLEHDIEDLKRDRFDAPSVERDIESIFELVEWIEAPELTLYRTDDLARAVARLEQQVVKCDDPAARHIRRAAHAVWALRPVEDVIWELDEARWQIQSSSSNRKPWSAAA